MKTYILAVAAALSFGSFAAAQNGRPSEAWNPDRGSEYVNPVLNADYSDPDVCRVGDDFYMTSSSFGCFPGLQILHSRDLVNWEIVGAALRDYPGPNWSDERAWEVLGMDLGAGRAGAGVSGAGSGAGAGVSGGAGRGSGLDVPGPEAWRTVPQHGNGVWAPAIRYHEGEFYIYCGDPDRGIFMVKTDDPRGRWDDPVWVVKAKGYIDPCPFWDEDGRAYLSHGCAGSRAGHKSVLFVAPMSPDGTRLLSPSRIVYDGHETQPTIEGTKFYKRGGFYYIFSPAGGVPTGWQVVLRSSSPFGPYEERVVMAEGGSGVNGPHQGAWVSTAAGEDWFMHFQDKDAYGRVVHLQPMSWGADGWPVIGRDEDGDGVGEPVMRWRKPGVSGDEAGFAGRADGFAGRSGRGAGLSGDESGGGAGVFQPADSDEFEDVELGLQWQWHAVPSPYWYYIKGMVPGADDSWSGVLRLYSVDQASSWRNLGDTPNLLLQKTPADSFTATARVRFVPNPQLKSRGESCGMVLMGQDYAALKMVDGEDGVSLQYVECLSALKGGTEVVLASVPLESVALPVPYSNVYMSSSVPPVAPVPYAAAEVYLRLKVEPRERAGDVPELAASFWYSLDGKRWRQLGPGRGAAGAGSADAGGFAGRDGGAGGSDRGADARLAVGSAVGSAAGSKDGYRFIGAPGKWIGAKFGFFCNRHAPKNDSGWMEVDWIRVTK